LRIEAQEVVKDFVGLADPQFPNHGAFGKDFQHARAS
jgi:hypothetical protein